MHVGGEENKTNGAKCKQLVNLDKWHKGVPCSIFVTFLKSLKVYQNKNYNKRSQRLRLLACNIYILKKPLNHM